ncbi:hypothetical protein RA307_08580 [Xanthobacteraceae bacterium Astr-EGSB]|uniref:hypothetical protein n=1 Tax=Astrobacterium formosum TaxID=3069710 RepID=UPI0027B6B79C|nr:hypothetical protein [Xanthobacteraceae bacterium Astr-EGSB]
MNTTGEPQNSDPRIGALIDSAEEVDSKDSQIAILQQRVQDLENKGLEERFLWFVGLIVLFDALIFSNMENWSAPVVIGAFELIAVVIMADRCKVDTVAPLIDQLTGAFGRNRKD